MTVKSNPSPAPELPTRDVLIVRIGTVESEKKAAHYFRYVLGDPEDRETWKDDETRSLVFGINKHTRWMRGTGQVYRVQEHYNPDTGKAESWRLGSGKFVCNFPNDEKRAAWEIDQDRRDEDKDLEAMHAKALNNRAIDAMIAPLRKVYLDSVGSHRRRLLTYIISEIVK